MASTDSALFRRLTELADLINSGKASTAEVEEYNADVLPLWEEVEFLDGCQETRGSAVDILSEYDRRTAFNHNGI